MTKRIRNVAAALCEVLGVDGLDVDRLGAAGNVMRKCQKLERLVLAHAVRSYLEHRIPRYSNKMVVFD
jgi:formyltetrahydrofolate hydrolase